MNKIEQLISKIKKQHNEEEIRQIFTKRLDDAMFESVAGTSLSLSQQRKVQAQTLPHLMAWVGFEILTNSRYLPENLYPQQL